MVQKTKEPESVGREVADQSTPPRPHDIDAIPAPSHPSKFSKVVNKAVYGALFVLTFILGVMIFWAVQTNEPLVIKNSPFPARVVADPTGQTGGTVFMTAKYCKNTDAQGQVRISFLSKSREQFTPIVTESAPKGCGEREFPVIIPTNLSEDEYRIRFRVVYDLNPIRKNIPVEFESRPVNIGAVKND